MKDWKSVDVKSPKDGEIVIVGRTDQKDTIMAKYYKLTNQYIFDNNNMKPTHWMPRPKKPTKETT